MKIAITGKMCSGKSTIAQMIMQLDNEYNIYSYGQKIKDIASELFNMSNKDRSLLINIADNMRLIDPDVWAKYIMKITKNKKKCIIDDLRFQNELDLLDSSWTIIRLTVSSKEQRKRLHRLYPENYEDHIKNFNHLSEKNDLNFYNKKIIDFNTENDSFEKIRHELNLLLFKK